MATHGNIDLNLFLHVYNIIFYHRLYFTNQQCIMNTCKVRENQRRHKYQYLLMPFK